MPDGAGGDNQVPMHLYCTLFDRNYLTRGLALHCSLIRHCSDFMLVVLCLDEVTHDALTTLGLPRIALVSIESLESTDEDLRKARRNRTPVEYYFTCKPVLMTRTLQMFPASDRVTYLDADLYYFCSPEQFEKTYADSSVALTPHGFPSRLEDRSQYGQYNAGWVSVSADTEGRRFLDWWRARCIEWCRLEVDGDRFGDQKYLDQVPKLFVNAQSIDYPGANVAPWNLDDLQLTDSPDGLRVDGVPLIFFHFHGVRRVIYRMYDSGLYGYGVRLFPVARRNIYHPYFIDLSEAANRLLKLPPNLKNQLNAGIERSDLRQFLGRIRLALRLIVSRTALVGP